MKQIRWVAGVAFTLAAVPVTAPAQVSVAVEVGVRPFADDVVVLEPPYWHRPRRAVVFVPRPYFYRRPFVEVPRAYYGRHWWRRHRRDWDDERWDDDHWEDDR